MGTGGTEDRALQARFTAIAELCKALWRDYPYLAMGLFAGDEREMAQGSPPGMLVYGEGHPPALVAGAVWWINQVVNDYTPEVTRADIQAAVLGLLRAAFRTVPLDGVYLTGDPEEVP